MVNPKKGQSNKKKQEGGDGGGAFLPRDTKKMDMQNRKNIFEK